MSNIVFHCPKCGQKIKAPDIMAGEIGDCPSCKTPIIIPTPPKKAVGPAVPPPARQSVAASPSVPPKAPAAVAKAPAVAAKAPRPAAAEAAAAAVKAFVAAEKAPAVPAKASAAAAKQPVAAAQPGAPKAPLSSSWAAAMAPPPSATPASTDLLSKPAVPTRRPTVIPGVAPLPGRPPTVRGMPPPGTPRSAATFSKTPAGGAPIPAPAAARPVNPPPAAVRAPAGLPAPAVSPQAAPRAAVPPVAAAVAAAARSRSEPAAAPARPATSVPGAAVRPAAVTKQESPRAAAAAPAAEGAPVRRERPARRRPSFMMSEKPAGLAAIPAILSMVPGLGQAYNLNVTKAWIFTLLFLMSVGLCIFKSGLGVPVVIVVMFLAMSDAYGSSLGKGFFGGLFRGIAGVFRFYFGLLGLLVWTLVALLATDAIVCWFKEGSCILATVDLSGSGAATRTVNSLMVAIIVLGAGLLLFFLHGFGRKFLWARGRDWHFMYSLRMIMAGALTTGLLGLASKILPEETAKTMAGHAINAPWLILKGILAAPQSVGEALGKTWPSLVPGVHEKLLTAGMGMGTSAVASFLAYPRIYSFVLLGGLAGFLILFLGAVVKASRQIPEFSEWLEIWIEGVRDRADTMRDEWQAFRKERAAAWKAKQAALETRQQEFSRLAQMNNQRLQHLETMHAEIAKKLGVEVPPEMLAMQEDLNQLKAGAAAAAAASAEPVEEVAVTEPMPSGKLAKLVYVSKAAGQMGKAAGIWTLGALGRGGRLAGSMAGAGLSKVKAGVQQFKEKQAQKALEKEAGGGTPAKAAKPAKPAEAAKPAAASKAAAPAKPAAVPAAPTAVAPAAVTPAPAAQPVAVEAAKAFDPAKVEAAEPVKVEAATAVAEAKPAEAAAEAAPAEAPKKSKAFEEMFARTGALFRKAQAGAAVLKDKASAGAAVLKDKAQAGASKLKDKAQEGAKNLKEKAAQKAAERAASKAAKEEKKAEEKAVAAPAPAAAPVAAPPAAVVSAPEPVTAQEPVKAEEPMPAVAEAVPEVPKVEEPVPAPAAAEPAAVTPVEPAKAEVPAESPKAKEPAPIAEAAAAPTKPEPVPEAVAAPAPVVAEEPAVKKEKEKKPASVKKAVPAVRLTLSDMKKGGPARAAAPEKEEVPAAEAPVEPTKPKAKKKPATIVVETAPEPAAVPEVEPEPVAVEPVVEPVEEPAVEAISAPEPVVAVEPAVATDDDIEVVEVLEVEPEEQAKN